ncbi:hemerythrin domain-containing protein [Bacillus marinisedimentorum]|uniref:hemerythrin domain-containing protein n=1 Tax=Bacillus marinisedimentorum TaxID=1821260 RepID=UPI0014718A03|nr:hemerythrin domain-containing protein [Bacillus marinisedimentorum]
MRQLNQHRSIHEAAYGQVEEMTEVLKRLYQDGRTKEAGQAEVILIEHWQDHILTHAESEEEGLYEEMKQKKPELTETITQLKRDHDLLRKIIAGIKELLNDETAIEKRLAMFDSLLVVNWHHSRDEERYLLDD